MRNNTVSNTVVIPYEEIFEIGLKSLEAAGVPVEDARITVEVLLLADLRGITTHGIQRLLQYIPRIREGLINPQPNIEVKSLAPAIVMVYGDNGLGPVVATIGMKQAIKAAKESGIAFAGCKDSNHFGAATPYVLMACDEKMLGITSTNAVPTIAPWGALEKRVGNNPLAIGVPVDGEVPFVLDMAMSISSRGKIREMADNKKSIPEGWALDPEGRPTIDPLKALKGFVLPIGAYKGYGLAVAMDILSGVLTGAEFSIGVKSLLQQWEEPTHTGHFFVAIDPCRFMPWETFSDRMRKLCQVLKSAAPIDSEKPVRLPGDIEAQTESVRSVNGIPFDPNTLGKLRGLAEGSYDYELPKF